MKAKTKKRVVHLQAKTAKDSNRSKEESKKGLHLEAAE